MNSENGTGALTISPSLENIFKVQIACSNMQFNQLSMPVVNQPPPLHIQDLKLNVKPSLISGSHHLKNNKFCGISKTPNDAEKYDLNSRRPS